MKKLNLKKVIAGALLLAMVVTTGTTIGRRVKRSVEPPEIEPLSYVQMINA